MRPPARSGGPPGNETALAGYQGGVGSVQGVSWQKRRGSNNPVVGGKASAILAKIEAIVAQAKANGDIRQRVRCAFRDGVVELEGERLLAAERFIASRRKARR
jgi:hypothetical protein